MAFHGHESDVNSVAWAGDDSIVVSGSDDSTVRMWFAETGELLRTMKDDTILGGVTSVVVNSRGDTVVAAYDDGTVVVWDARASHARHVLRFADNRVSSLKLAADEESFFAGSWDTMIYKVSLSSGRVQSTFRGHFGKIYAIDVKSRPDGVELLASASQDGKIIIWNAQTTNKLHAIPLRSSWVMCVTLSESCEYVFSGGLDNTISIHGLEATGTSPVVAELEGHEGYVSSIAQRADRLVSSSGDGTIRVWDVRTRACLMTVEGHGGDVMSVQFSPSGNYLASGSCDATVRIWEAATGTAYSLDAASKNAQKAKKNVEDIAGAGRTQHDRPDGPDLLRYQPYADAITKLLGGTNVSLPVTMGIYAPWGSGKSFLLNKLKANFRKMTSDPNDKSEYILVHFNAWQYEGCDNIWAGLISKMFAHIEARISWRDGISLRVAAIRRQAWRLLIIAVMLALMTLGVYFAITVIDREGIDSSDGVGGGSSVLGSIFLALTLLTGGAASFLPTVRTVVKTATTLSTSRSSQMRRLSQHGAINDRIGFLGDVKLELKNMLEILQSYARRGKQMRMVLMIDDLDRCSRKKAVEVLEALILLLTEDEPLEENPQTKTKTHTDAANLTYNNLPFVVFLAIDARVVAKSIEENYGAVLRASGVTGFEFLDKIVQIPFSIPVPRPAAQREFAHKLIGCVKLSIELPTGEFTMFYRPDVDIASILEKHSDAFFGNAKGKGGEQAGAKQARSLVLDVTRVYCVTSSRLRESRLQRFSLGGDDLLIDAVFRAFPIEKSYIGATYEVYGTIREGLSTAAIEADAGEAPAPKHKNASSLQLSISKSGSGATVKKRDSAQLTRAVDVLREGRQHRSLADHEVLFYNSVKFTRAELEMLSKLSLAVVGNPRRTKRILNLYTIVRELPEIRQQTEGKLLREKVLKWIFLCEVWPYRMSWVMQRISDDEQVEEFIRAGEEDDARDALEEDVTRLQPTDSLVAVFAQVANYIHAAEGSTRFQGTDPLEHKARYARRAAGGVKDADSVSASIAPTDELPTRFDGDPELFLHVIERIEPPILVREVRSTLQHLSFNLNPAIRQVVERQAAREGVHVNLMLEYLLGKSGAKKTSTPRSSS